MENHDAMSRLYRTVWHEEADKVYMYAMVVITTIISLLLVVLSLCIWPVIIQSVFQKNSLYENGWRLLVCGGVSALAVGILSVRMAVNRMYYSFRKNLLVNLILSIFIIFVLMACLGVNILSTADFALSTRLFTILVNGLTGIVVAVLPSLLFAGIGWFIRFLAYEMVSSMGTRGR